MASKFITVSIEIMHDKNLTPNQKFILAEIEQLCSLGKGCFATNRHFSELIGIKIQGVSNAISDLAKKGYIDIDNSNTNRNNGRIITIHSDVGGVHSDVGGVHSDVGGVHSDVESKENIQVNIQSNNKNIKKGSYESFINFLKENAPIKSKVTATKDGKKLYSSIEDKKKMALDYIQHQEEKGEYAKRITAFMEDYNFHSKQNNKSEDEFKGWK